MIHTNAYHRIVKNLRSNGSFFVVFLCLPFFWEFWPYFIFAGFVFISLALFFKSIFWLFLMFPGFFCIICLSRKSWWFNQSMKFQNLVFFFPLEAEKKICGCFFLLEKGHEAFIQDLEYHDMLCWAYPKPPPLRS